MFVSRKLSGGEIASQKLGWRRIAIRRYRSSSEEPQGFETYR